VRAPRRGFLYWANLDKRRPALVISLDARNEPASDVMVVPCTTTLREAPTHVRLGRGEGGLEAPSMLKCEPLTTLPMREVEPLPLGRSLGAARLLEVERGILRAIGVAA
jgi:mRNA-degrading endonuclease toxin of MazEF toxin-antitoxin module